MDGKVIAKDAGTITSYGYALDGGLDPTVSEQDYAELMASYATVAQQAAESASNASQSATNASQSATDAETAKGTAQQAATDAQTAQASAQGYARSAQQSAQSASQSATDAESAKNTAVNAVDGFAAGAQQALDSVNQAGNNWKSLAEAQKLDSEAWAVGQRDGEDVGSSDPAYHNNAKWYAEQASSEKTSAQTAREGAETAASNASQSASAAATSADKVTQSTEIIRAISTPVTTDIEVTRADGTFINTTGEVGTTGTSFYTLTADITAGEKYIVNGYAAQNCFLYVFTDGINTIYKSEEKGGAGGTNYSEIVATAPTGATKLIVDGNIGGTRTPAFIGKLSKFISTDSDKIPTAEVAIIPAPVFPHYPVIDSINKKVTAYSSTVIVDKRVSNGRYYTLMEDAEIDYSSISSSAIGIYFDTVDNVFVADAYGVGRDGGRFLLFMLIRTNPVSVYHVTVSAGFPVVVDGMIDDVVYSDNKNIRSINHRGLEQVAPENTLIAFKYSKTAGFDGVETDVRFTSDDVPVLLHDATINRTARNADGTAISEPINIADITYNEALNYDFGVFKNARFAGTKIPTFEQFIRTCRSLGLHPYIELKVGTEQQIQNLNAIVIRNGMQGKVSWISYGLTFLAYIHAVDPKARIGVIVSDLNPTESFINQVLALKSDNEVFYDLDSFNAITSEGVERMISLGLPLELYTGTIANIINADPYITGFTLGAFNAGKELITNWSNH